MRGLARAAALNTPLLAQLERVRDSVDETALVCHTLRRASDDTHRTR
jgi:hypothetical protein